MGVSLQDGRGHETNAYLRHLKPSVYTLRAGQLLYNAD